MRDKLVLVTGAGGFLGQHVVRRLASDWSVVGVGRSSPPDELRCSWVRAAREPGGLAQVVRQVAPALVVDLAFENRKRAGVSDLEYLAEHQATHMGVFEECADLGIPVLVASSSAVYGSGAPGRGIAETAARRPVTLYGTAKAIQEMLAEHVMRTREMALCLVRIFNLLGPGKGLGTVAHDWVSQISAFRGTPGRHALRVRSLSTSRDFVDPRDVADAMAMLTGLQIRGRLEAGSTFNVGAGRATSLQEIIAFLRALCGIEFDIEVAARERSGYDAEVQVADVRKIEQKCGWRKAIDWRQSLEEIWRQYTRGEDLANRAVGSAPPAPR